MNPFFKKIHGIKSDFEDIFFLNEYRSLAGLNFRTILALVAIMFSTFLALGVAIGGIENLEKKMDNPFTNWVNIDVNSSIQKISGQVLNQYSKQEVLDSFALKTTNGFTRYVLYFYDNQFDAFEHKQDTLYRNIWGRTIESDEVLFSSILSPKNVLWQNRDTTLVMESCDIIVSSSLLESTKFEVPIDDDSDFYLPVKDENRIVFLKVYAVVRELPGLGNRFVSFPKLHNIITGRQLDGKTCQSMMVGNNNSSSSFLLMTDDPENVPEIEAQAQRFFQQSLFLDIANVYPGPGGEIQGLRLSFPPSETPSIELVREFLKSAQENIHLSEYAYIDGGGDFCGYLDDGDYNYLAFHFDQLEHIRKFRRDLDERFDIEMDMSQIESKENFWLVSRLTFTISLILLAFGILSIVLYVKNSLKNHLIGIRSNLGTFQAFGLNNGFLIKIYLKIILSFLTLSILISFGLAVIVDRLELLIRTDDSLFNIFSPWIVIAVVVIVFISLILAVSTIKRILSDTPGNLIYER